jgi:chemotaxis protein methyltransferase CheR
LPAHAIDNPLFSMEPREFKLFRTLVHEQTGIFLRDSKQVMLAARLSRRLRALGLKTFAQYYDYLQAKQGDSEEIVQLINCVTTNKTSFYRERHHFDYLAKTVVSQMRAASPPGAAKNFRVWSAACSTGEEPYTLAITLLETLHPRILPAQAASEPSRKMLNGGGISYSGWKFEVVASDIDTSVLATAKRGIYPEESLESVPPPLWKRYFLRGKDEMRGYVKVKPEVAQRVRFQRVNLNDAQWGLEGRFDAIFFRNALIYFNQETQNIFLRKMARYLQPRGYLFLGNAEHIPWLHELFEPLQQTMYRMRV